MTYKLPGDYAVAPLIPDPEHLPKLEYQEAVTAQIARRVLTKMVEGKLIQEPILELALFTPDVDGRKTNLHIKYMSTVFAPEGQPELLQVEREFSREGVQWKAEAHFVE